MAINIAASRRLHGPIQAAEYGDLMRDYYGEELLRSVTEPSHQM